VVSGGCTGSPNNEANSLLARTAPTAEITDGSQQPPMRAYGCIRWSCRWRGGGGEALKRLTVEPARGVHLKVYQGFKFDEMAGDLGWSVSTIQGARLYTASIYKENSGRQYNLAAIRPRHAIHAEVCEMNCLSVDLKA